MTQASKPECHESGFVSLMTTSVVSLYTSGSMEGMPCAVCGIVYEKHPAGRWLHRLRLDKQEMTLENFQRLKRDLLDAQALLRGVSGSGRDGYLDAMLRIGDYWMGYRVENPDWRA